MNTRGWLALDASICIRFSGMKVLKSTDLGKSFKETKTAPAFPSGEGRALVNIWSIEPGKAKKELWAGVEPASLFKSYDGGNSWEMAPAISNHDHARKWSPGHVGLCMHTTILDVQRVHLVISTARNYLSEAGGEP